MPPRYRFESGTSATTGTIQFTDSDYAQWTGPTTAYSVQSEPVAVTELRAADLLHDQPLAELMLKLITVYSPRVSTFVWFKLKPDDNRIDFRPTAQSEARCVYNASSGLNALKTTPGYKHWTSVVGVRDSIWSKLAPPRVEVYAASRLLRGLYPHVLPVELHYLKPWLDREGDFLWRPFIESRADWQRELAVLNCLRDIWGEEAVSNAT